MQGDVVTQADLSFIAELSGAYTAVADDDLAKSLDPGDLAKWIGDMGKTYTDLIRARFARGAVLEPGESRLFNYTGLAADREIDRAEPKGLHETALHIVNKRRIFTVWGCIALIVSLGVFPPWIARGGYPLGYHLLFLPPLQAAHIDQSRLGVEWILSLVVAAGLLFAWPSRRLE